MFLYRKGLLTPDFGDYKITTLMSVLKYKGDLSFLKSKSSLPSLGTRIAHVFERVVLIIQH